jgi:molybdopterin-guanine dinucleotide biosynthesis protein B
MPPIISFIGYHDSGKTTLASQVVAHLKKRDYRVAVIKSTKETGLEFDQPGTDTHTHRLAGADAVALVAPDQMFFLSDPPDMELSILAHRFFPDMDIVIAEGFKNARRIAKIEVCTDENSLLRERVSGVIAVVSDGDVSGDHIFRREEGRAIADFIEKRFLRSDNQHNEKVVLLVNGRKVVLKEFVQDALAGTVEGFIHSLKATEECQEIELRIKLRKE